MILFMFILGMIWGIVRVALFYDGKNYHPDTKHQPSIVTQVGATVLGIMWGVKGEDKKEK